MVHALYWCTGACATRWLSSGTKRRASVRSLIRSSTRSCLSRLRSPPSTRPTCRRWASRSERRMTRRQGRCGATGRVQWQRSRRLLRCRQDQLYLCNTHR
jgi:hypothetical protein